MNCQYLSATVKMMAWSLLAGANLAGLYTWEKDRYFRYIRCNDNYARAAGYDSPHAMIGKSDNEMPWNALADFFREGDQRVLDLKPPARMHVQEKEIMVDRVADILVCENQLMTQDNMCVGVTGYFLDITGQELITTSKDMHVNDDFHLGAEFGNQSLTPAEAKILRGVLKRWTSKELAQRLGMHGSEERPTSNNRVV